MSVIDASRSKGTPRAADFGLAPSLRDLSLARTLSEIVSIATHSARSLLGAEGVSFILREGGHCHYVDEDAVAPLWKGLRFPIETCVSGWCMVHDEPVVIPDIAVDPRVPQDAYRPTFVRALAMAPIRDPAPVAALAAYWSKVHTASPGEMELLRALAAACGLAIARTSATYRAVFDTAAVGVARVTPGGVFAEVNDRFCDIAGYAREDLIGRSFAHITHPDDLSADMANVEDLLAGRSASYGMEKRYWRRDGRLVWVHLTVSLVRDAAGAPGYFVSVIEDITARKGMEAQQEELLRALQDRERHLELLVGELGHRVKNALAIVQAMASQMKRDDVDPRDAYDRLEARLMGLSEAHEVLTGQNWEGAALADVVLRTVRPIAGERAGQLNVRGAPVWLAPETAVALSLTLHELATNALKYGALSTTDGRVAVSWRRTGRYVTITWREQKGPPVRSPTRIGFGSRLIRRELTPGSGVAELGFEPAGVVCRLRCPAVA
jgi:PAS domain S-box-containing protein